MAEEERTAGGWSSPGHCFCGGEECCGLGEGARISSGHLGNRRHSLAWEQWLLGGFGETCPVFFPPSFPSFLSGPGHYLLLLSGEEYPEWLRSNVGWGRV